MKKIIMAFLFMTGVALGVRAQDKKMEIDKKDVPQAVMDGFTRKFADARDVEWKKKGDDYKVTFEIGNTDHYAMINSSGTIVYEGKEIPKSQLPAEIKNAIKKDYPNLRIDDVYTVEKNGNTSYRVKLDGSPDRKVTYSSAGAVVEDKEDN